MTAARWAAGRAEQRSQVQHTRRQTRAQLKRTTFRTSRELEFWSRKELVAQTGHQPESWPLMLVKELLDNALDASEEHGTAPVIELTVDDTGITVRDNGPGIPASTVEAVLDFGVRVSSREAYVSPTRGAQGNALKTVLAVPFVLDDRQSGHVVIEAQGVRHVIDSAVDMLRQQTAITYVAEPGLVRSGTSVSVRWPDSASSLLSQTRYDLLKLASDFSWLNPHLTLSVAGWNDLRLDVTASDPTWRKWRPNQPTSPHWYNREHFERLISAYLVHDQDNGRGRTVREFVSEFDGLTSTVKQKAVLEATGLGRTKLAALYDGVRLDGTMVFLLLRAMQAHTRPVKPLALGLIGKGHIAARFEAEGCVMASFRYRRKLELDDGMPTLVETAFAYRPAVSQRRLVTGVNWSPGISNPFRSLGRYGRSLDSALGDMFAACDDPIVMLIHMACPRVEYTDRGKSAITLEE